MGVGETTIFTNNVASAMLSNNGEAVNFHISGTFATSINSKQVKVYFGATTIFDSGSLAIGTLSAWVIDGQIIRTGATTQKANVTMTTSSATLSAYASYTTPAETLANSIGIGLTGTGTANNDVVGQTWKVYFDPAP